MVGGPPAYDVGDLAHRRGVADLRPGELDAAPQRVHVTVAEGRQQGAAVEVDDLAGVVGERERVDVERDDPPVVDGERPRARTRRVPRADGAALEHQVDAGHESVRPRCWT